MPVYLKEIDNYQEIEKYGSVLIVPCRFCPAASLAVSRGTPYVSFFTHFLKTAVYERSIETLRSRLEGKGVKTGVFRSRLPHQFVVCMWTARRREKLLKRAAKFEALVVLGCEAAVDTVYDSVQSAPCKVYQGMRTEGIMSIKPRFDPPGSISLELNRITPLVHHATHALPWNRL